MPVSSKLIYTLIFKQVVHLMEAFQSSFGVLSDETIYNIYLWFIVVDSKFSLKLLCSFIHYLCQQKFTGHLFGPGTDDS